MTQYRNRAVIERLSKKEGAKAGTSNVTVFIKALEDETSQLTTYLKEHYKLSRVGK